MEFSKALGFSVADNPVEEVEGSVFVFGISGVPEPVDEDGHGSHDHPCGDAAVDVGGVGHEEAADSQSEEGEVEPGIEGPVEVGGDAGVDLFVDVDLVLVDFPEFLLPLEELEGEQFGVVVLGVGECLDSKKDTRIPLCILCSR